MTTSPKAPQDHKPKAPKPSEAIDAQMERDALYEELLGDMPALLPPVRFRISHRHDFDNLSLEAAKSKAFDGDGELEFDMNKPEDIERFQALRRFVASIDLWAERIAEDPVAYAKWSEGKTEEHFMALFRKYQDALGESSSSES